MRSFARRRPALVGAVTGLLVAAGTALAAFLVYSGITGSGGAKVQTAQTVGALTFTPASLSAADQVAPGTPGKIRATVTNNDPNHTVTISTISVTGIVADNGCNTSGLTADLSNLIGQPFAVGATNVAVQGTITASNAIDPNCSGASLTINLTGTTTAS